MVSESTSLSSCETELQSLNCPEVICLRRSDSFQHLKTFLRENRESCRVSQFSSRLRPLSLSLFPPHISWHWHTLQVQATAVFCCILDTGESFTPSASLSWALYLSQSSRAKTQMQTITFCFENRLHTVTLCSRILWDPINDSERLDGRLRSGKSDTHTKSPMLIWALWSM